MQVGVIATQGWTGEYDGWQAAPAWERTTAVARQAERLGFESIWLGLLEQSAVSDEPLEALAEDARAAGVPFAA